MKNNNKLISLSSQFYNIINEVLKEKNLLAENCFNNCLSKNNNFIYDFDDIDKIINFNNKNKRRIFLY